MSQTQSLSFYTIGEDLTQLLRDFIQSGSFYNAIEVLKDGGFNQIQILQFMLGKLKFEGDTRINPDLNVLSDDNDINNTLIVSGWRTLIAGSDFEDYEPYEFNGFERLSKTNKHLKSLTEIIPLNYIKGLIWKELLENEGYNVYSEPPLHRVEDGVFLRDGHFVECGYQSHRFLYPVLYQLGLSESPNWTDDKSVVHVTARQLSGSVSHSIESYYAGCSVSPSDEQVDALFKWREHFPTHYGYGNTKTVESLRDYIVKSTNKGSKYGNLQFLKRFYNFRIPQISLTPLDVEYCIRTSPKYSLAGLLNSKFDINENSENEIWADWEKYKDVINKNELSIFYQEYLSGQNGVAHYVSKGNFTYAVSDNRGDIVGGKKGSTSLSNEHYEEIRTLCRELHNDLGEQIQVEFVIHNDKVWVVQLRTINKPEREDLHLSNFSNIVLTGYSFTSGEVTCDLSEVLIVEEDSPSEALLGKKALIVKSNVEFSHILALSQSLRIPSIYGVEFREELPQTITLNTRHRTGIITK